ncbi:MAG: helix-hairpin-helix domain-containing protein, partial [Pseudomonadota bacterium]|nr:helix-hairpin-helix domain-containing protein [Pseudomonadota bacterium]
MTQSILHIRGIGPAMQVTLAKNGFKTIEDLANTTVELLIVTPGFSELKASQVINDARNLLESVIPNEKLTKVKAKDKKKSKKAKHKNKKDKDKKKKKAKDETKDTKKSKKSKK